jgi:hypothetical protein
MKTHIYISENYKFGDPLPDIWRIFNNFLEIMDYYEKLIIIKVNYNSPFKIHFEGISGAIGKLYNLGLIFKQESTGKLKLTLASEAIMSGEPPVAIIKNQILKYQFSSAFSLSRGVAVNSRSKFVLFGFYCGCLRIKMSNICHKKKLQNSSCEPLKTFISIYFSLPE